MPIPESQLETWSHQGSITQSSSTYNTIKSVLEGSTTPYAGRNFKVFLQGSYGNDTNIYAESDVDIVIRLDDANLLPANDVAASIVGAGHPGNIDTVLVAGQVRKYGGRLVGCDIDDIRARAEASRDRLFAFDLVEGARPDKSPPST